MLGFGLFIENVTGISYFSQVEKYPNPKFTKKGLCSLPLTCTKVLYVYKVELVQKIQNVCPY